MRDSHVFEYAVIRVVPHVEREEFINVGVILYCKDLKYLNAIWKLDESLVRMVAPTIDLNEVHENLCAFDIIIKGGPQAGSIGQLEIGERFRWLTATRSTILQPSSVHPGYTSDPEKTLERLFSKLVERP
jgi:hypothetical protein